MGEGKKRTRLGRRGRAEADAAGSKRKVDYRNLRNPFPQMSIFSEDRIEAIHEASLKTLEDLGMKVLLPEARALFRSGGAKVDDSSEMVYIGREIVEAALASAPKSFTAKGAGPDRDLTMELGSLIFQPGAGAPHSTDLVRGRRPGSARDFKEFVKITQHFDVLHMVPPVVEPQDVAPNIRHYFTMDAQLTLSDKLPFVFSRGTPQVLESFEML